MFKELSNIIAEGQTLNLSILKVGDTITVSVLTQDQNLKDEAKNKIAPLIISASPEELDEKFIETISEPVQKTSSMLCNMSAYEKQLEVAQQASKEAETQKKKEKDAKEKVEKQLKEADKLLADKKLPEALKAYKKVLELDAANSKAKNKIAEIQKSSGQNSIFSFDDVEEPATDEYELEDDDSTEDDEEEEFNDEEE